MRKLFFLTLIYFCTTYIYSQDLNLPLMISGRVSNSNGMDIATNALRLKVFLEGHEDQYLTEQSPSCGYILPMWFVELGNLPSQWDLGDNLVIIIENTAQNERIEYIWQINNTGSVPDLRTQTIPLKKQISQFELSDRGVYRGIPVEFRFYFLLSQLNNIQLDIFDINGNNVYRSKNPQQLSQNKYYFVWDGKSNNSDALRSGIYFYFLNYGGKTIHSGIVALKNE